MSVQQEKFKAIADKIRRYLASDDLIKPNDFADKIDEVVEQTATTNLQSGYNMGVAEQQVIIDGYLADFAEIKEAVNAENSLAHIDDDTPTSDYAEQVSVLSEDKYTLGKKDGYTEGETAGIEQGKQAAYDEFWDSYQNNGNRVDYRSAFSGVGWTTETFKPIYPIKPTTANGIFTYCTVRADLGEILKEQNISIDFSSISNADQMFHESKFTALPIIDLSGVRSGSFYLTFSYLNATKIEKIILKNDGSQSFNSSFLQSSKLTDVVFEGVIGQNLDMRYSPLNKESIMGKAITLEEYEALSDTVKPNNVFTINGTHYYGGVVPALKSDATGKTLILKKTAVDTAFETSEGAADGSTSTEWITLITPKSNEYDGTWTISLV